MYTYKLGWFQLTKLEVLLTVCSAFKKVGEFLDLIKEFQDVMEAATEQLQFAKDVLLTETKLPTLSGSFFKPLLNLNGTLNDNVGASNDNVCILTLMVTKIEAD